MHTSTSTRIYSINDAVAWQAIYKEQVSQVKYFQLCQFDGIVLRACISSGQPFKDFNDFGQTGLSEDFLDKGYSLFVDNYYNSIQLTKYLATRSTYNCGTLKPIRKGIP